DDVVALSNYVLYLHAIEHEYVRARKLYRFLFEFMEERGPDNPFVLYSVAIFGAVTCEEDWGYIKDWAWRGNKADIAMGKKAGKAATSYNLANSGFFKAKALLDQSGESWHNYALCRMLVYKDLEGARDAFIRAVVAAPHDKRISQNFNILIQDVDYFARDPPWDCWDEFQAHQREYKEDLVAKGEKEEWEECEDDEGNVYWYNDLTGEAQWHKPGTEPPKPEIWRPEILPLCRGKLIVTLVSGEDVRGRDSTLNAYMKIRIGEKTKENKKKKPHKTKTAEKAQAGGKISFRNEKVNYMLQDPNSLTDKDGNLKVHFELYDDNFMNDPILCTGFLNVIDMVSCPWWFGDEPKEREIQMYKLGTTEKNGSIKVKVEFWRAQIGCLRVILDQARNLANKGGMTDTQDPYCKMVLGKQSAKSKTINNGGTDPKFNMEELLMYVGMTDWDKKLVLSVWDDDTISDDLIGQAEINLFDFMAHNGYKKKENP
ncbi:hypothetical protein TrCOL_g9428, partial [Triparma columacea]